MVLATAVCTLYEHENNKKKATESLTDASSTPENSKVVVVQVSPFGMFFDILIGALAIYLSWTCNTKSGIDVPMKILYAFFAYIFGIFYLLYYIFARYDNCVSPDSMVGSMPEVKA